MLKQLLTFSALAIGFANAITPSTPIDVNHLPKKSNRQGGQIGYNRCTEKYGAASRDSLCQNAVINNSRDFCLFGPKDPNSAIGDVEGEVVSYCTRSGYGSRLFEPGTIKGASFIKTPHFVQVSGVGNLVKMNVRSGDDGGELDPHGATQDGNPIGGLVFTRAFSQDKATYRQIKEWNMFISHEEFCFRACVGDKAADWCPHIYDVMGCSFNNPGTYTQNVFEDCDSTEGSMPGIYNGQRWYQGVKPTPEPQAPGVKSNCRKHQGLRVSTYGNQRKAKHPIGRRDLEDADFEDME